MGKSLKILGLYLLIQTTLASAMNINTLYSPASSNSPGIQITNSSGTSSVIQYTKISFYTGGCTLLLGEYPVTGGERNFTSSETVSINSNSMYKIAQSAGADQNQIGCARISICSSSDGTGNCNSRGEQCPSFTLSCTDLECSSNNTVSVTSYGTGGGAVCVS